MTAAASDPAPVKALFFMSVAERRGGAERMLLLLLRHLDRTRVEPRVVFLEPGPFASEIADLGIPTHVIAAGRLRNVARGTIAIGRMARLIRRERPDVCVSWMGKTHLYGGPAARLSRSDRPVLWWLHTIPSGDRWDRLTLRVPATAVGASSHAAANSLGRLRPVRPTFVVHPGVEDDRPADWERLRREHRERLGISDDQVLVGLLGRFQRQKGQHRLVEAMRLLREAGTDVEAVLVGGTAHGREPDYEPYVSDLIASYGLVERIHRVDHVEDARPWIYASDVVVNATRCENLSLGLLEAAVAERAIVAIGDGGTPEAFEDGKSALVLPDAEPAAIADAIGRLVADPELREALGRAARTRFEDAFTAAAMSRTFEENLWRVVGAAS
jgi:glycosyltransferase involved in cell wall biosynthesis